MAQPKQLEIQFSSESMGEKNPISDLFETKLQHLQKLLSNEPNEEGKKSNKRDSEIEKTQLEILHIVCIQINEELNSCGVNIETEYIIDSKKHKNQWYINRDGEIRHSYRDAGSKNECYDSKSFDAVIPIEINGYQYNLFFILKGVERSGGHQGNVLQELGGIYATHITKNQDRENHFIFLLDGEYVSKHIKLDQSIKYDVTTSENLKQTILNFISKKIN